ncbi:DsbA family protein [Salicibibacter cibarius]|nr:DsbA family protein [Salicibibacter cibarius]
MPSVEEQPTLGDSDAPVTVIEFGDYKCPACKDWDETVFPQLEEDYIESGQVQFAYINTLFHGEESLLAALASEAVWEQSPGAFWSFHKDVFQEQPEAQSHDDAWVTIDKLVEIASGSDGTIDEEQLEEDIQNAAFSENVMMDQELVEEYEVSLTPTIIINGIMLEDPFDYERIVELIEEEA